MKNADMPAMPVPHQIVDANHIHFKIGSKGLTKREHFASMAMQGMASADIESQLSWDDIASNAVEAANALLKALEQE